MKGGNASTTSLITGSVEKTPTSTRWIDLSIIVSVVATLCAIAFALWKLTHSESYLSGWGAYLTGLATLALVIAALVAARTAVLELSSKRELERAKWLAELYRTFFQRSQFKPVRSMIDYVDLDGIRAILVKDLAERKTGEKSKLDEPEKKALDGFTDFFNFFEMMGYLCKLGIITKKDVDAMFGYYLKRIEEVDRTFAIRDYLKKSGFEYVREVGLSLENAPAAKK